jgi:hypothetical protein
MEKCGKCGADVDFVFRYCPHCGSELHFSTHIDPSSFFDVFNSFYNLLSNKGDKRRAQYIDSRSEAVIARRCQIEHEEDLKSIRRLIDFNPERVLKVEELYRTTASITLGGYIYRLVEEMLEHKKSPALPDDDITQLLAVLNNDAADDFINGYYSVLNVDDSVDMRVMLCLSVRWDNGQIRFMISDKNKHEEWWGFVVYNSLKIATECHRRLRTRQTQESIEGGVVQDLLFGYIVRLVESLVPFEPVTFHAIP